MAMASKKSPKKTPKRGAKQQVAAKSKPVSTSSVEERPRHIKPPKRKPWRRKDKRFRQVVKLPSAWKITKKATRLLTANRKLVGGMVLVYGVLALILVHGLNGGTDVTTLKQDLNQLFQGNWGHLASGLSVFAVLLTSSGSTASDVAGAYQAFLIIVVSLAIVWTFRQLMAEKPPKLRVRDGFYQGMYPLIPVILVLLVIGLQLVPLLVGGALFATVQQNNIAVTGLEQLLWIVIFVALACISLYVVCSSIFALYIVTLPNMTPLKALRSARGLVKYRRPAVLRKLLFLPLLLLIIAAIIMLPFILFITPIAQWVFFVLTLLAIAAVHAYMYTLYRELLNEQATS